MVQRRWSSQSWRLQLTDDAQFEQACSGAERLLDIVFIHGLTGNAKETWRCDAEDTFWPEWLQDEMKHVAVYTLGYPASLFEKWAKKEMDLFERAGNVLEQFAAAGIGTRPTAFVSHSLGGILAKVLLRRSAEAEDEDYKAVSEATRLVVFLSTPHTGASLASACKVLPFSSKHIALLADQTGFLHDLNSHYRSFANGKPHLRSAVYYEKHKTKGTVLVVSRDSADPGVAGTTPVPVDKDHINICKPTDRDDIVYQGVKRHISRSLRETLATISETNGALCADDYTAKADGDRRDLLEKLIAAGREHEYEYANNAQNGFARRFTKTGLFTTAREDHDVLLSEIEARFITHVYHPVICKDGTDNEVRTALQTHVIDPLAEKVMGSTKFSAKTILSALYFLTEQCHIRWDPPK